MKKSYGNSFIFQLCFSVDGDDDFQTKAVLDEEMLQAVEINPAIESHVVSGLRTYCKLDERAILVSLLFDYTESQIHVVCPLQTSCSGRKPET